MSQLLVRSIRRYPVKAMGGEYLQAAAVDHRGIMGDRWFAVHDSDGKFATGKNSRRFRRHDEIFGFTAATGSDDRVTVTDGSTTWAAGATELDAELSRAFGTSVTVQPESTVSHYDSSPLSLVGTATLAWCAARWGGVPDGRRIRANIVVETTTPWQEDGWVGRPLQIGGVTGEVDRPIARCRMIDLDTDGVEPTGRWRAGCAADHDVTIGVYLDVLTPGPIAVGDVVTLG